MYHHTVHTFILKLNCAFYPARKKAKINDLSEVDFFHTFKLHTPVLDIKLDSIRLNILFMQGF